MVTFLPNFVEISQLFQEFKGGTRTIT